MARGRGRIDGDGCFLPLKLVHRTDASVGQASLKLEDLRVVGRDDDNIIESNQLLCSLPIHPTRTGGKDRAYKLADLFRLLR